MRKHRRLISRPQLQDASRHVFLPPLRVCFGKGGGAKDAGEPSGELSIPDDLLHRGEPPLSATTGLMHRSKYRPYAVALGASPAHTGEAALKPH
jgi:hypothetical protein